MSDPTIPPDATPYNSYINNNLNGLDPKTMEKYIIFGVLVFVFVVFSMRLAKKI